MLRIVVVEDDALQYDLIEGSLQRMFAGVEVARVKTARAFKEQIEHFRVLPPGIFVIDVMIPWQIPEDSYQSAPPEVEQQDFRHLGIQCLRWLASDESMSRIPVILYSELEPSRVEAELIGLSPNVFYLKKESGFKALNRLIFQLVRKHHTGDEANRWKI